MVYKIPYSKLIGTLIHIEIDEGKPNAVGIKSRKNVSVELMKLHLHPSNCMSKAYISIKDGEEQGVRCGGGGGGN